MKARQAINTRLDRIIDRDHAEGTCPVLASGAGNVRTWGPELQSRAPARGFHGRDAVPDARL